MQLSLDCRKNSKEVANNAILGGKMRLFATDYLQ